MRGIFLIPPSEGKQKGGNFGKETLTFLMERPFHLLESLTPKDLKCKDDRFFEAMELNKNLLGQPYLPAYERYNGVMYKAIDRGEFSSDAKAFFDEHFFILSAMYGLVSPRDHIANYKLPIEAKGMVKFWQPIITKALNDMEGDVIVDLLPDSYKKMILWKDLKKPVIRVDFLQKKGEKIVKMAHGVKVVKGKWIANACQNLGKNIDWKKQKIEVFTDV